MIAEESKTTPSYSHDYCWTLWKQIETDTTSLIHSDKNNVLKQHIGVVQKPAQQHV